MTAAPIAYGIDFGTTNSAISVAYENEAEMVPLGRQGGFTRLSMIYLDETGNHLVGEDAIQTFLVRGGHGGHRLRPAGDGDQCSRGCLP